jgi:diguanylate cyclase (GGDEF)-like protein
MPQSARKTDTRRRLIAGVLVAVLLSAGTVAFVYAALQDVATSVARFGFYSFRSIHVTLLDASRLNDAVRLAIVAPGSKESLDFLAEANDLAYIRFVTEDRTQLVTDVPRYADISNRMKALIEVVDAVLAEKLPMDTTRLRRVKSDLDVLLSEMSEIYYQHGNLINNDVGIADARLDQLTLEVGGLLIVSSLLAIGAVVLLIKQRATTALMRYQADHDALTGLKNRAWLSRHNEKMFDIAHVGDRALMLFLIDLDRFKEINDTYGHRVGDTLLVHVAEILEAFAEDNRIEPVRIGGDELAVLAIAESPDEATDLRAKIHQGLNTTVELAGHQIRLGASVGVATYPEHGSEFETLAHNADIALYKAKETGRARMVLFDPEIMGGPEEKGHMQARIREAIAGGEFELYWQPIFNLRTASLSGAEALLRWNDREKHRVLMPKDFLPLAEQSDLILDIDRMVLARACAEAARWEAELKTDFVISVNISARHLQSENFPAHVASVARRAGLTPSHLEIDITEGIFVADRELAFRTVRRLRELGFRVALDDFGRGTADLQYLAELDIDRLKIDGAFIEGVERSPRKQALVTSIIAAGRATKAAIVAENVETEAQMAFLIEQGCDFAQGYLLAEPADSRTFRTYLRRNIGRANKVVRDAEMNEAA